MEKHKTIVALYNSPMTREECRILIHYVKTNKIPSDLPELVNRYLAKIKTYLITYNDEEKIVEKIHYDLNRRKNPRFVKEKILIKKYVFPASSDKKASITRIITCPPMKVGLKEYEDPYFDFWEGRELPVRKIKYNFKTKSLYMQVVGSCESRIHRRRSTYRSEISVNHSFFTFEKLFVMFLIYTVQRYHHYKHYAHSSNYRVIYCFILTTEDLKGKSLERYKLIPLKRYVSSTQVSSINNPWDLIPLLPKKYVKEYKTFLKSVGLTPPSKKLS